MQVACRRWIAVLVAGSAFAPKGACARLWLRQSADQAGGRANLGRRIRIRAHAAIDTKVH
jgi:hypothetical protein